MVYRDFLRAPLLQQTNSTSTLLSLGKSPLLPSTNTHLDTELNINDVLDLLPVSTDWDGLSLTTTTTAPTSTPPTTQVAWSGKVAAAAAAAAAACSGNMLRQHRPVMMSGAGSSNAVPPLKSPISPYNNTARSPGYSQRSPAAAATGFGPVPSPNQRSPSMAANSAAVPSAISAMAGFHRQSGNTLMSPPPTISKYTSVKCN